LAGVIENLVVYPEKMKQSSDVTVVPSKNNCQASANPNFTMRAYDRGR